ncbi:hypothetical protein Patl1_26571 [Pistacia atlantica]|uniref:Uncharacterized protein n=1 Tax=Pistacia atlantica TaxID=434234 RepID=A0ACC1B4W4_9ROSI|nr:hypothetical protein Patl1_26571 [Pistacia atlantica]
MASSKKMMALENYAELPSYILPSSSPPSSETRITLVKTTLFLSVSVGYLLLSFHQQYSKGNPVPIFIFEQHPSMFDAFVAAIIFSFVASITGLLIASKKRLEILRNLYFIIALFSIVSAISILAFVLSVESYKLFSTGCKFMM